ncbi:hypothetical protein ACGFZA_09900 [Streptomyces sp. NPDC048211]|uniref:hypothetical protein n=1 Tax=Streptomyces sp. NPDC048211 TaxID=3365516 RepID=UPI0037228A8C
MTDPDLGIDGDVYVFPHYLAATTGIGDPALEPLMQLGWELTHDDLGNAYLNAPDHKVRLGFAQFVPVTPPPPQVPTPLDVHRTAPRRRPALTTRSVPRWSTTTPPSAVLPAGPSSPRR